MYIRQMQRIIDVHGLLHHCHTNETQIKAYFFISEWNASNRLKLNRSKSEFLHVWCTTLRRRRLLDYRTFALDDTEVRQADTTAALESTLTAVACMTMTVHVSQPVLSTASD